MANRNDRYKRLSSCEDLNWRAPQPTHPQHTQREITAPIDPQPPRAQGNPQATPSKNNVRIRSSIAERNQRMQMRSEMLSDGGGSTTSSDASHNNNNRSQTSKSTAIIENNGVTPHSHTACLECATFLSYNIWNNCPPDATHPEYKVVDGPCNHCARGGEEVKLHCEPLRCNDGSTGSDAFGSGIHQG
ncbi:hypothetical protein DL95DRAFT_416597 [Leptodontidium sp. 2 PMI_412]|nr:hypothetical protein DL95DRAFT_416597 [Leptodontidium sp. 2 PMI_412]